MGKRRDRDLTLRDPTFTVAALLALVGTALLLTALARVAVLWLTPQLSNEVWKFATTRLTVAEFPLLGLGAVLVCAGALRLDLNPRWTRAAAAGFGLLALLLVTLTVIFVPTLSVVVRGAPRESLNVIRRELISSLVTLAAFTAAFAGCAVVLWLALEKNG